MAAANDPPTSSVPPQPGASPERTGIMSAEGKERIPLPPPPGPKGTGLTPDTLRVWIARLDGTLVAVTLVLAVLVASFLARNSDLWTHLAAGRLIAHVQYPFGHDPFTYTCADCRWINTAWLADLAAYGLFTAGGGETQLGGTLLVVAKAILIALLTLVLLGIRRPERGWWAPAACTALALVAMSPRLLLQPTCISFLFLGLTLYLLQRPPADPNSRAGSWFRWTGGRAWVLLPVLFVLWVNLDAWFLLGPVALLLYLVGGFVQQALGQEAVGPDDPRPAELPRLAVVLAVGVAACLLNPYHVEVFSTLPPELAALGLKGELGHDPWYESYFQSPFAELADYVQYHASSYFAPNAHGNIGGIAYFVLALAGLVSFALNLERWSWWRALVWLAFAGLSGWQSRAVPFFAVAAAPITALNLQDYAIRRFGTEPSVSGSGPLWSLGGRALTVLLGLGLIFLAWPGWLNAEIGTPRSPHRVAWDVDANPSLRAAAQKLLELRREGALAEGDHGFNFTPDVANYWAWFAPGEKAYFDYRFQLSPERARTYGEVRRGLPGEPPRPNETEQREEPFDWQGVFRAHQIKYLALDLRVRNGSLRSLLLWTNPVMHAEWYPVYNDGETAIFGWKAPALAARQIDLPRQAFGRDADRAPAKGPDRPPHEDDFWDKYVRPPLPAPVESRRAGAYLDYYRFSVPYWQLARNTASVTAFLLLRMQTGSQLIGVAGTGGGPAGVLITDAVQLAPLGRGPARPPAGAGAPPAREPVAPLLDLLRPALAQGLLPADIAPYTREEGPPAAPLLAVRAARRALRDNPDSADAYWQLANAYQILMYGLETGWTRGAREDSQRLPLREAQLAAALQNTLLLNPRRYEAHQMIAQLVFGPQQMFDLELQHLQQAVALLEEERSGMTDDDRENGKRLAEPLHRRIDDLERQVKDRTNAYTVQAKNQPAMRKVDLALAYGLAQKALELLEQIDVSEVSKEQMPILYRRAIRLYLTTGQVQKAKELASDDPWAPVFVAAALGDYDEARQYLDDMGRKQRNGNMAAMLQMLRAQAFSGMVDPQSFQRLLLVSNVFHAYSDLMMIRGLLALEEGDVPVAEASFKESLRLFEYGHRLALHVATPLASADLLGTLGLVAAANEPTAHGEPNPVAVRYLALIRGQK